MALEPLDKKLIDAVWERFVKRVKTSSKGKVQALVEDINVVRNEIKEQGNLGIGRYYSDDVNERTLRRALNTSGSDIGAEEILKNLLYFYAYFEEDLEGVKDKIKEDRELQLTNKFIEPITEVEIVNHTANNPPEPIQIEGEKNAEKVTERTGKQMNELESELPKTSQFTSSKTELEKEASPIKNSIWKMPVFYVPIVILLFCLFYYMPFLPNLFLGRHSCCFSDSTKFKDKVVFKILVVPFKSINPGANMNAGELITTQISKMGFKNLGSSEVMYCLGGDIIFTPQDAQKVGMEIGADLVIYGHEYAEVSDKSDYSISVNFVFLYSERAIEVNIDEGSKNQLPTIHVKNPLDIIDGTEYLQIEDVINWSMAAKYLNHDNSVSSSLFSRLIDSKHPNTEFLKSAGAFFIFENNHSKALRCYKMILERDSSANSHYYCAVQLSHFKTKTKEIDGFVEYHIEKSINLDSTKLGNIKSYVDYLRGFTNDTLKANIYLRKYMRLCRDSTI